MNDEQTIDIDVVDEAGTSLPGAVGFVAGSSVATATGPKAIEDVTCDDRVLDAAGTAHRVVALHAEPPCDVVDVVFEDGTRITATPDQTFRVLDEDYRITWRAARDLVGAVALGMRADADVTGATGADTELSELFWGDVIWTALADTPPERDPDADSGVVVGPVGLRVAAPRRTKPVTRAFLEHSGALARVERADAELAGRIRAALAYRAVRVSAVRELPEPAATFGLQVDSADHELVVEGIAALGGRAR